MRSPASTPSWRPLDKIASTLADLVIGFNNPAVLLASEQCSYKKLISLFNYAVKKNLTGMNISNLEIFMSKVADCDEIDNTDTYFFGIRLRKLALCQDQ